MYLKIKKGGQIIQNLKNKIQRQVKNTISSLLLKKISMKKIFSNIMYLKIKKGGQIIQNLKNKIQRQVKNTISSLLLKKISMKNNFF